MGILHAARASTLALLTLAASLTVAAAAPETDPLPRSPDYRGEIRRGPDGKLMAVPSPSPEPKAEEPPQPRSSPSPTAGQKILRVGPGTAIATVGAAERNEFFAPERGRAIAAVAGDDFYLRFVKELHRDSHMPAR